MKRGRNAAPKKGSLHPRNPHAGRYDFASLCASCPALKRYLKPNPKGDNTIDFSDNKAVLCLNKALLAHHYHVDHWTIPPGYLCPAIPGRADYIHYLADLLAADRQGHIPKGQRIKALDIGTGASCIYPIIGSQSYGWQFVASEIDPVSIKAAELITKSNPCLKQRITVRQQKNKDAIFTNIINPTEHFDVTLCNPPFHASMADARYSNQRKVRNLNQKKAGKLNFGGQQRELWTPGGEIRFLKQMARESVEVQQQVGWFSSLVSKSDNIRPLKKLLLQLGATQIEVIKMSQGQKISRLIAWRFRNSRLSSAPGCSTNRIPIDHYSAN